MSAHSKDQPQIRLDSFAKDGFARSWRFSGHMLTLSAMTESEVIPLLEQVELAAGDGLYAVGFVAYEAAHALNRDLPENSLLPGLPLAWFALFRERIEVDRGDGLPSAESASMPVLSPAMDEAQHGAAIARIRDYIASGDSYQVNYTFPLLGCYTGDPAALYHRMGLAQQAPFCACIDTGTFTILSASPELFFALKDGNLTARPMKGTAPRGRWAKEDGAAKQELQRAAKEQAENLMIVDLLRNDLGQIAATGTVRVASLFDVESYPTVHQLTSTITAQLRADAGLTDIFRALFPCGSITGAPKRRSMEIIRELEQAPRGVYCGAIGYVAPGGEALFSVPIRTMVVENATGRATLGVGSGVTWDSRPEAEYAECLAKAAFIAHQPEPFRLIESLRLEDGDYPRLEAHLRRLGQSADYFGFTLDMDAVREALHRLASATPGLHKARLLLAADGSYDLTAEPLFPDDPAQPLRIGLSVQPVDSGDRFRYHKTDRRAALDLARTARPECAEVIFLNERGEGTEGSYHNVVVKLAGQLFTPPLECGLLPGVMRQELLGRGEVTERILTPADLFRADEIWLINAVRGWRRACLSKGDDAV